MPHTPTKRRPQKIPARIRKLIRTRAGIRLDVGCGAAKQDGFVGMDVRSLPGVDIVHDFTTFPWPLPDACVNTVVMSHVWEHVSPLVSMRFMAELHRICKDKAQVFISGPYGVGFRYIQDPTHCRPVNEASFLYFDPEHPLYEVYHPPPFKLLNFERVPAGMDSDFNAVLLCLKNGKVTS